MHRLLGVDFGQFVKLDGEDVPRGNPSFEKVMDLVTQRSRLADLARSPDDDDRAQLCREASMDHRHQVTPGGRQRSQRLAGPPRVHPVDVRDETGGEPGGTVESREELLLHT